METKVAGEVSWSWLTANDELRVKHVVLAVWVPSVWIDRGDILRANEAAKLLQEKAEKKYATARKARAVVSELWPTKETRKTRKKVTK